MKLGIIFIAMAAVSIATAQQANSARIDYIRLLATSPADLSTMPYLIDSLADKDPLVRHEALKTWSQVGAKLYALSSKTAFINQLIENVRPKESDSEQVKLQALRTLCGMGRSVKSICPIYYTCGFGIARSLSYNVNAQLRIDATKYPKLTAELLADSNPDVVFNAVSSLGKEFNKTQLNQAKTWLLSPNRYFRVIGALIIFQAFPDSTAALLAPLLDDVDKDVQRTIGDFITINLNAKQIIELSQAQSGASSLLRRIAIDRFYSLPLEKSIPLLRQLINDSDPKVRAESSSVLKYLEKKSDIALLK